MGQAILKKLSDNFFNDNHPNGINTGFTEEINDTPNLPVVNEYYRFGPVLTSRVLEILEQKEGEVKFKTKHSTYLLTY
jgi:hypothetical protein